MRAELLYKSRPNGLARLFLEIPLVKRPSPLGLICRASRAEPHSFYKLVCVCLLYNILTCYMLVHNASRTCGDVEGRC